jgi:hypothetical protein
METDQRISQARNTLSPAIILIITPIKRAARNRAKIVRVGVAGGVLIVLV